VSNGAYAVSKACAEFAIADYQKQYFEGSDKLIGIGRAGNVVIGGDLHTSRKTNGSGRIFSDCYEALAEGRPPEIFTPGFTRPYTYGLDIVSGYMTLMSRLDRPGVAGEAFNFGPYEQFGISNALLATKICELWGEGIMWRSGTPRPEPLVYQSLNCRKSNEILKWRPAYTLYEALASTTRWYKSWAEHGGAPEPGSMYELDRQLIQEHRTAASNLGIDWAAQPEAVYA
jgi:CDP-glucose 4,6-dehydratase